MNNALIQAVQNSPNKIPDDARYKCRFEVRSESSNSIYRISYDAAPGAGYWTCSCRGNIAHGQCKHLTAIGLKGRKFGKVLFEDPRRKLAV